MPSRTVATPSLERTSLVDIDWCDESNVPRSQCVECQEDERVAHDDREFDARREDGR